MTDIFEDHSMGLESPGFQAAAVVPSDSTDLGTVSRALYIGFGGDLRLTTAGGTTVVLRNVASGMLPIRVARVHATETTATDIVAIW